MEAQLIYSIHVNNEIYDTVEGLSEIDAVQQTKELFPAVANMSHQINGDKMFVTFAAGEKGL